MIDENLIRLAREKAGKDVHDVNSAIGIYRCSLEIAKEADNTPEETKKWNDRAIKYERILRSFLVTGDMKTSTSLVERSLGEDLEGRASHCK